MTSDKDTTDPGDLRPRRAVQPRILIAEDDADVRDFVAAALRSRGYEVVVVSTGAELLSEISGVLLDGARDVPDVIISDVRMPGFTGSEILAGLRDAKWPTALVLMTAYADDDLRAEVARSGVDALFEKPFDIDDLITLVMNISPMPRLPSGAWH